MIKIKNKELKKPIFQGGMGVGVSLSGLAGAVAKAGGAGTISAAQIGFLDPEFDKDPFEANLRAIKSEFDKARKISPDGIIGFNIMVAMQHYEEYVRAAVKAGTDFLVCGAGPLAGGHLGFAKDQLSYYTFDVYEKEVRNIIEVCREYAARFNKEIPVVLAGGISTKEAADHAFSLGVDAIQAATRFVTTYECDASDAFKKAYLDASKEDIILIDSPVGLPGRAVRNKFSDTIMSGGRIAPVRCRGCLKNCRPDKIPYCITDALITSVTGDAKNGLVFCGADAWRCDHLEYAEDVIESLLS